MLNCFKITVSSLIVFPPTVKRDSPYDEDEVTGVIPVIEKNFIYKLKQASIKDGYQDHAHDLAALSALSRRIQ